MMDAAADMYGTSQIICWNSAAILSNNVVASVTASMDSVLFGLRITGMGIT